MLTSAAELASSLLPLAKAMLIVPIRPGALAALTVADYDRRKNSRWIHPDKVNAGRWVTLPARNKDGTPHESVALLAGLTQHKLSKELTIYWLRHSRITDLITAGVAPMTIAKMAGTSVEQIEKTYHHLIDDTLREALVSVAGY